MSPSLASLRIGERLKEFGHCFSFEKNEWYTENEDHEFEVIDKEQFISLVMNELDILLIDGYDHIFLEEVYLFLMYRLMY